MKKVEELEEDVRITDINHILNMMEFTPTLRYIPRNSTLLDVGCGKGTFLLWLKKHRPDVKTEGIDINPKYVEICRSKGLNVKLGDANNLTYQDKSFDVVTCFHVLEHLPNDREVLEKLIKIAKIRVILILPKTITKLEQLKVIDLHHYIPYYTPLTLKRLLKGIKAEVKPHYAPTGIYESWMVIINAENSDTLQTNSKHSKRSTENESYI